MRAFNRYVSLLSISLYRVINLKASALYVMNKLIPVAVCVCGVKALSEHALQIPDVSITSGKKKHKSDLISLCMGMLDYTLMNTECEKNINNHSLSVTSDKQQIKPQATLKRYRYRKDY